MAKVTFKSALTGAGKVLKNYFFKMRFFFLIFALLGIFFRFFPGIDIYVSGLFYRPDKGFYLAETPFLTAVYHGVNYVTVILVTVLVLLITLSVIKKSGTIIGIKRKAAIYLLAGLILAPGIVVNVILKEHVGRPRPADVTLFGGEKIFQPPFKITEQCENNCSFVSGHAALGFYFTAFSLVGAAGFRRKSLLAAGIAIGWVIGIVRIMQGRHFFTDVLFAFFFVYAALRLLYEFLYEGKYTKE